MYFIRKLKPPKFNFEHIFFLVFAPLFLLTLVFFSATVAYLVITPLFAFLAVISLWIFLRTTNTAYFVLFLCQSALLVMSLIVGIFGVERYKPALMVVVIIVVILIFWMIYLLLTRQMKWRSREILELAAQPVTDVKSGFTERPFPVGKINFSEQELNEFTGFIKQRLIALPYFDEQKTFYVINFKYSTLLNLSGDFRKNSWVSFDKDGDVQVHISMEDYLKYKDAYAFDQLCLSLGKLFIEFMELYKKGEGARIIDKFNDLRLNPIIE